MTLAVENSADVFVCVVWMFGRRPKFVPWIITMASIAVVSLFILPQMLFSTKLPPANRRNPDESDLHGLATSAESATSGVPGTLLTEEQKLILERKELDFQRKINRLQLQIKSLEDEIKSVRGNSKKGVDPEETKDITGDDAREMNKHTHLLTSAIPLNDPLQVVPYDWFNGTHLMTSTGVVRVSGRTGRDLDDVLHLYGVDGPDNFSTSPQGALASNHFEGGIVRTVPSMGNYYELIYGRGGGGGSGSGSASGSGDIKSVVKMKAVRPFTSLHTVDISHSVAAWEDNLAIILTISDCVEKFSRFIHFLHKSTSGESKTVHLIVVHFGEAGLHGAQIALDKLSKRKTKISSQLLTANEPFSKSRGINMAVDKILSIGTDPILAVMDVDIAMSRDFFARCRHHVSRGRSVYFPFVFGLYNPNFIYPVIHREKIPPLINQLRIDGNKGTWKLGHYAVSCQYVSDLSGIIESAEDSQTERELFDQNLYVAYLKSHLKVYRVPDPSVFHIWHDRRCLHLKEDDTFNECLANKILSAGSQLHLGFLAFQKDMDISRGV